MRYTRKDPTITAELYQLGMEDGFARPVLQPQIVKAWEKEGLDPSNIPYLLVGSTDFLGLVGKAFILPGYYVVTRPDGSRFPCSPEHLKENYDPI